MKFTIENVGPIKKAEVVFGELTIVCGKNNTGKTYLTYNAYNFLTAVRKLLQVPDLSMTVEELCAKGKARIPIMVFFGQINALVKQSMDPWVREGAAFRMGSPTTMYVNASMALELTDPTAEVVKNKLYFEFPQEVTATCSIEYVKRAGDEFLDVALKSTGSLPDADVLRNALERNVRIVLGLAIPQLFAITCERTGISVFKSHLRVPSSWVKVPSIIPKQSETIPDVMDAVIKEIDFSTSLGRVVNDSSYIAREHPEIIRCFDEIAGGDYGLQDAGVVRFVPKNGGGIALTMTQSSSSVRALGELGFYLKHVANRYQCLIVDEPELNLHPESQRKLARLFVRLVNAGVYVAITTHSDYIIKEINTMMMLGYEDDPRTESMRLKYGYDKSEVLKTNKVRAYCMQGGEAVSMDISQDRGISVDTFDESIRAMALMQRDILYGDNHDAQLH